MTRPWIVGALVATAALAVACVVPSRAARADDEKPKQIDRGTLVVHALTSDGAPIAGGVAEAWLVPAPTQETWGISATEPTLFVYAATDAAGVAKIVVEEPAVWRVSVRAPGRATESRTVRVALGVVRDVTMHLAPGFALEGTVVDQTGKGTGGVTVYAGRVGWEGDLANFLAKATSDAAGRYRLEGLAKGPVDVWASRGGVGRRWIARLDVPGFDTFDLPFPRGGRMTGVVRDVETGAIVAGARIRAFDFGSDCVGECVSDASGVYVLDATAPRVEVDRIVVDAPGRVLVGDDPHLPPQRRVVLATAGTYECDLSVRNGARVVGTVTADGKPVAGARVTLWALADDPRTAWHDRFTTTAAGGGYTFDGVDTGPVVVHVAANGWSHPGFAPRYVPFLPRHDKAPDSARARVPKTGEVRIDVQLERPAGRTLRTITGRVVDESGTPVAGVDVDCGDAPATTGADGSFRLEGVDLTLPAVGVHDGDKRYAVVTLNGPGFEEQDAAFDLEANDPVVVIRAAPKVTIRVVDEDGKPIAGATVTFGERRDDAFGGVSQWPPLPATVSATTGPDGRVRAWTKDSTRSDEVTVRASGFGTTRVPSVAQEPGAGVGIDVKLTKGRDVVVKVVAGAAKSPVPGAWLTLGPDEDAGPPSISALPAADQRSEVYVGRTRADGTFRLRDVGPDPIRVHVAAAGHYAVERRIDAGATEVVVDMNAHLSISGRFVLEDGSPGAGVVFSIFWVDHPKDWPCYFGPTTAGADGAFRLEGARPGTYEVEATSWDGDDVPDYAPMIAGPFRAGTTGIVVTLRRGWRLTGAVVGEDGKGVAGADVSIGPRADCVFGAVRHVATADDGAFDIPRGPQGPVHVRVVVGDYGEGGREWRVIRAGPVDPKAGEPLRIVVEEGLAIEGRITRADGRPYGFAFLAAVPVGADAVDQRPDLPGNACRADEDGRFRIGGLAPGRYRIFGASDPARASLSSRRVREVIDPEEGTPAGTKGLVLTGR